MNLLFLDSIERETYGGMEEWIRLVALGLKSRGHRPVVVGRGESAFLRRVDASAIETHGLSISGDFNPATIGALKQLIESRQIECVVVNFNKDVRLGGLAAKFAGSIPVVWSVGLDIAGDSWIHRTLTPKLVEAVIVPSESLKGQLLSHGYLKSDDIEVILIGIEESQEAIKSATAAKRVRTQFGLPDESVLAVTVGRFVEQKGHTYLLSAIPQLTARHPQLRFLFLGDGPLEVALRKQGSDLGISDRVTFGGMQEHVAPILAGCDLIIHPSIEEPFGIAILEGMRAGLPVVASRVGGIPEVLSDSAAGILVEPKDPDALANGVDTALEKLKVRLSFGEENISRFRALFTLSMMIDRVEQKLASVCRSAVARG